MSLPPHKLRRRPSFHRACRRPLVSMRDAADPTTAVAQVTVANRQFLHPWLHRNSRRRHQPHSLWNIVAGQPSNADEVSSSAQNRSRRHQWHPRNLLHRHRLHNLPNNVAGQASNVAGESNNAYNRPRRR